MGQGRRRRFIFGAGALFALPLTRVQAQAPQYARIGYLALGRNLSNPSSTASSFSTAMRELGWVEGANLTVEWRFADGQLAKLPELASDLVRLGVQVIVTPETADAEAARRATWSIPIVIVSAIGPVKAGSPHLPCARIAGPPRSRPSGRRIPRPR